MRSRFSSIVVLLLSVALFVVTASIVAAQPRENPRISAAARTAVAGTARARVMIVFDVPGMKLPRARGGRSGMAAPAQIASARANLLAGLDPREFEILRSFKHVNGMAGYVNAAGLDRLAAMPGVLRVDLDQGGSGHLDQARPLAAIDTVKALGLSGAGVTVAVLDSGYDSNHADLSDDLVAEACFCSGGGGCCPGGGSVSTAIGSAEDDNGHGTNVSGVITGAGNVAPAGAAPNASIVAIKVLDSTNGFCCTADVIAGLDWVIDNRPDVDIVNMSLGTFALYPGDCDTVNATTMLFATAIDTLHARGVPVFVSSGNDQSGTQMAAPACIANAISVGAVWDSDLGTQTVLGCSDASTAADQVTCFSNSDASTDLFAPGARTSATGIDGGISTYTGTSQAAPLAAACAALLLEDDPTLTAVEIEALLEASPTLVTDTTNGLSFPRLDCQHALDTGSTVPTLAPVASGLLSFGLVTAGLLAHRVRSRAKPRSSAP